MRASERSTLHRPIGSQRSGFVPVGGLLLAALALASLADGCGFDLNSLTGSGEEGPAGETVVVVATAPDYLDRHGYTLVEIPIGQFVMGSEVTSQPRDGDETSHAVEITRPFLMGATEVPQALWTDVMGSDPPRTGVRTWNGSNKKDRCASFGVGPDLPVHCISWFDAIQFCNELSHSEGRRPVYTVIGRTVALDANADGYRLPSEAEWEYAARAGGGVAYSGWDRPAEACTWANVANQGRTELYKTKEPFPCDDGYSGPAPIGSFAANPWGLKDLTGNVWEWTWDNYGDYPSAAAADPTGAPTGDRRVIRGGAWHNTTADVRVANRFFGTPDSRSYWVGLRLARTPSAVSASNRSIAPVRDGEVLRARAEELERSGGATSRSFVTDQEGWRVGPGTSEEEELDYMFVLVDSAGAILTVGTSGYCVDQCSSSTYVFDPEDGRLVLFQSVSGGYGDTVCGASYAVDEVEVRYPRPGEENRTHRLRDDKDNDLGARPGCDARDPGDQPDFLHASQLPVLHLLNRGR
jgi:formylglycine-generating enzyme required for sulfatase activity